jgi:iron complex transport system ATP-binding protein
LDGAVTAPSTDAGGDVVLRMAGVGVRRGSTHLLRDLDWTVELDERWVVLGPNGAGKTTLLQVAAAQLHPTTGRAEVLGERLGRVDVFELRPRIGLTSAALAQRMPADETVLDLVVSAGYAVVGRWREEYDRQDTGRARHLLYQLGVHQLADRRFGTLSEGERKRVQIARALMTDPELLLLDEPAAGLDLAGREQLVGRLAALAADPDAPTMVLVTHHVEEIPPGVTHGLLLRDGQVVAAGLLTDVLTPDLLSVTFGMPLALDRHGGRWAARAATLTGPAGPSPAQPAQAPPAEAAPAEAAPAEAAPAEAAPAEAPPAPSGAAAAGD